MNLRDIERLEYRLEQTTREKDSLQQHTQTQQRTIQHLQTQIDSMQQQLKQNPMHLRQAMQSPLSSEGKIAQLEQFIKGLTFQLDYLQQTNSSYSTQLTELQTKLSEMELVLCGKDHDIDNLNLQIQSYKNKDRMHQEMIQNLNKKLTESNQHKLKLIEKITDLQGALEQQKTKNQSRIADISHGVASLKEFIATRNINSQTSNARDFSEESRLLKMQQEELQARNQQILRLKTIIDGHSGPSEEGHLKNTIKHLRGQIGRYNTMMKNIIQRSALAESMIKKYEQLTKKCENQVEMIACLKEENAKLKGKVEALQLELRETQGEIIKEKKINRETKTILVEALTENQSYHQLIHQSYPQNYESYINRHKQNYLERLQERAKTEKWTSVEELIEVNQRLRKRLKLI